MAKTKYTHNQISSKMVEQNPQTTPATSDESTADSSLEIGKLLEEKGLLETELTQSESEKDEPRREFERWREELSVAVRDKEEFERSVEVLQEELSQVESRERGLIEELENVAKALRESEEVRVECEGLTEENQTLRNAKDVYEARISELEKGNVEVVKELDGLKSGFEVLVEEKEAKEREIVGLNCEKLKGLERVGELEEEIERVKRVNVDVVGELEGLKSEFETLAKENLAKECDIESVKRINEALVGKLKGWEIEYDALVEELTAKEWEIECVKRVNEDVVGDLEGLKSTLEAKEREIESLIGEKVRDLERLEELKKEIESVNRVNQDVVEEKRMLEEAGFRQESEIRELRSELDEIRGNVLLVQASNRDQLEKNVKLLSEVSDCKCELTRVINERDGVRRDLDEEKMNGEQLRVNLSEMSKEIEETAKVMIELRSKGDAVVAEKQELESKYSKLVEENGLTEKKLVEANENITELQGLLSSKSGMFESALTMLRNTTMQLSEKNEKRADEGVVVNERSVGGEMDLYMTELEAIRAVLRSREDTVGEMKQQMENLQWTVVDAKKQKSYWTMVSSATTVLAAAISFAYAAKAR